MHGDDKGVQRGVHRDRGGGGGEGVHGVRVQEEGHGVHEDGVGMQGDEDEDGVHGEGGGLHEDGEMGKWCKGNGVGYMGMEGVGKGVRCIKEGAVHGGDGGGREVVCGEGGGVHGGGPGRGGIGKEIESFLHLTIAIVHIHSNGSQTFFHHSCQAN